tara:strand:- start:352 stop:687 length:336 start_codon:yes stop_codon:yes gene_type:complete
MTYENHLRAVDQSRAAFFLYDEGARDAMRTIASHPPEVAALTLETGEPRCAEALREARFGQPGQMRATYQVHHRYGFLTRFLRAGGLVKSDGRTLSAFGIEVRRHLLGEAD